MIHKYRIQKQKRDSITPHQRFKRNMKRAARYMKVIMYKQSLVTRDAGFIKGLAGFIIHTYKNKYSEPFLLRLVTWSRLKLLTIKIIFDKKIEVKNSFAYAGGYTGDGATTCSIPIIKHKENYYIKK